MSNGRRRMSFFPTRFFFFAPFEHVEEFLVNFTRSRVDFMIEVRILSSFVDASSVGVVNFESILRGSPQ